MIYVVMTTNYDSENYVQEAFENKEEARMFVKELVALGDYSNVWIEEISFWPNGAYSKIVDNRSS